MVKLKDIIDLLDGVEKDVKIEVEILGKKEYVRVACGYKLRKALEERMCMNNEVISINNDTGIINVIIRETHMQGGFTHINDTTPDIIRLRTNDNVIIDYEYAGFIELFNDAGIDQPNNQVLEIMIGDKL